jgi:hypothetical protein
MKRTRALRDCVIVAAHLGQGAGSGHAPTSGFGYVWLQRATLVNVLVWRKSISPPVQPRTMPSPAL